MKVLVFTTQFHLLSGAEKLAVELAVDLNRRGIHSEVLSLYREDLYPGTAEKARELRALGVPAVRFLGLPVNPPIGAVVRGIAQLRRLAREEGYDIIETSQLSPTVIAALATLGTPTRHLGGVHDVFELGVNETFQDRVLRLTARWVHASRYYAISQYVADRWANFTSLDRERVHVVLNGIADAAFEARADRAAVERELHLPPGARIALFVGRLNPRKGLDTVLEALGPVLESERLVVLYVGHEENYPASRAMLDSIRARITAEGWNERVHFLGRREDVYRLMASSDVLVHPARIEGFGLVLAEALAAGLPVVASGVDGIPEVLSGTDSEMVPADDPQALRSATLRVLAWTASERGSAVALGRRRAAAFRSERRTTAMIEFMRESLARPVGQTAGACKLPRALPGKESRR